MKFGVKLATGKQKAWGAVTRFAARLAKAKISFEREGEREGEGQQERESERERERESCNYTALGNGCNYTVSGNKVHGLADVAVF